MKQAMYSRGIQLRNFSLAPPTPVMTLYPSANCLGSGPRLSLSARGTVNSLSLAYAVLANGSTRGRPGCLPLRR